MLIVNHYWSSKLVYVSSCENLKTVGQKLYETFFVSPSLLPKCSYYRISCGLWYMNVYRERKNQKKSDRNYDVFPLCCIEYSCLPFYLVHLCHIRQQDQCILLLLSLLSGETCGLNEILYIKDLLYSSNKRYIWFDFLKAKLLILSQLTSSHLMFPYIYISQKKKKPFNVDLHENITWFQKEI